jgi:hypothetical protein
MTIVNEELVQKAVITADALASQGKLNPKQSDRFIDLVVDETVLKDNARIIRFRNEELQIDKLNIGTRAAVPKAEAVDPGIRRGVTTSQIQLQPKDIMVPIEIGDVFRRINIEGEAVEDHIINMFTKRTANDLEELYISGNTLGAAAIEEDIVPGGSSTGYVQDSYLALTDGWQKFADSGNVVDAAGQNIGLGIFGAAVRAMPTKFRRNLSNLRWFMSPNLWSIYIEKLSTRVGTLGDNAAGGIGHNPLGIKAVPVPLWDFQPKTVEHITLTSTTPVALSSTNVSDVVVHATTLSSVPTDAYIDDTDYTLDEAAGTIAWKSGGAIGETATVKVTYSSAPQLILTHMDNFIVGIGKDITIEKDRDIFKGVNQYAITVKAAVQIEELTSVVKVRNIGTGV